MPVIKSAIKKLRRDKVREKRNDVFRSNLEKAIRLAKKTKSAKTVSQAVSLVDHAVKKNIMHKNRAARIKSTLSKLAKPVTSIKKPTAKRASSKSSPSKPRK